LRLRARDDGQLGVLRQHDAGEGSPARRRHPGRQGDPSHPRRGQGRDLQGDVTRARRLRGRPRRRGPGRGRRDARGRRGRQVPGLEGSGRVTKLTPVLSATWGLEKSWTFDTYAKNGGYEAAAKALKTDPADIVQAVKDSGLR